MSVKNKARIATTTTAAVAGLGLTFALSACGASDPEGAVQGLLDNGDKITDAFTAGDEVKTTVEASKYMCADNAAMLGGAAAMAAESGEQLTSTDFNLGDVEYEITGSVIDGDKATVTVEFTTGNEFYPEGSQEIPVVKQGDDWYVCQDMESIM